MDGTLPKGQRANMAQRWTVIQTRHWQELVHVWGRDTRICPQSRVLPRATLLDSDSDAPVMPTAVCGQLFIGCIRRGFDAACDPPEETSQACF